MEKIELRDMVAELEEYFENAGFANVYEKKYISLSSYDLPQEVHPPMPNLPIPPGHKYRFPLWPPAAPSPKDLFLHRNGLRSRPRNGKYCDTPSAPYPPSD